MTANNQQPVEQALFAMGCFWCVEDFFRSLSGVTDAAVGYAGGKDNTTAPTYKQVCTGQTGHAECILVTFDPTVISYEDLLAHFWEQHDPTTLNRQGPDVGTQYRSAIFTFNDAQQQAAEASKAKAQGVFKVPIVTVIEPVATFWRAEEYHQRYFAKARAAG